MLIVVSPINAQTFEILAAAEEPLERFLEGVAKFAIEISVNNGIQRGVEVADPE